MPLTPDAGQLSTEAVAGGWRWRWRGPSGAQHHGARIHPDEDSALREGDAWAQQRALR
ncbi:hypothetical protein [Mycolicibacterium tokaiense]|uniref:hypothetical protein n=1 Tax=Mycolicibacterium tokaiense TaxID=39695 RepID=UPI00138C933E|nr:hypothetical protein [Mycolicibacterium tokaiense]BBY86499.1 hypothetical protein MTOK_22810 [Mycolicibacterium tokaiense]